MPAPFLLVTGGARSGKSRWAESRLRQLAPTGTLRYIATAEPSDEEMRRRIDQHRLDRGAGWNTIEAPFELVRALELPLGTARGTIVDCLTLWLSNRMLSGESDEKLLEAIAELARALRAQPAPVVLVTNEVGGGVVPEHPLGRRFRDLAGIANQRLAAEADEVVLLACGLPLTLRASTPRRTATRPAPMELSGTLPDVPGADAQARAAALAHQDRLCKPQGSLGRLEELGAWYAASRGCFPVSAPRRARLVVMAGDHGVVAEGVSPYPSTVTAAMVSNFLSGGAAVNTLAAASGVELVVVDVGVAGDLTELPVARRAPFVSAKVRHGTGNLRREPAMTRAETLAAIEVGLRVARESVADGVDLLCVGEMGIGNTTAAAALLSALAGVPPELAVGRGTGIDDEGLQRKTEVVRDALALHASAKDPLEILAALGGLELAGMVGLYVGAAAARVPLVADGFISSAAALVACALRPRLREHLVISHRSAERGHAALCEALGLDPLFDLGLRLGEGSGAVLAAQLIRAAVRTQAEMATFASAQVPDRS